MSAQVGTSAGQNVLYIVMDLLMVGDRPSPGAIILGGGARTSTPPPTIISLSRRLACAGPHSQNPTLSNDWTAQMQVLMSNPELAQEQFAQWQLIHQQFQHLQYQQQLAASSNLESWQMFHHPGENDKSTGGQLNLDTRMD